MFNGTFILQKNNQVQLFGQLRDGQFSETIKKIKEKESDYISSRNILKGVLELQHLIYCLKLLVLDLMQSLKILI